jgi:hypothetical protein
MKIHARLHVSLWLLLTAPAATQAQFNYILTNDTVTITEYTGVGGAVTIPNWIQGYPVTAIAQWAFAAESSEVTSVSIGTNVTSIGRFAFSNCGKLSLVIIPNSVNSIGTEAFANCSSLIGILVGNGNPNYCDLNGVLFNKNQTTLIQYPGAAAGDYTPPNWVTTIGEAAFGGCGGLTKVSIPEGVSEIGEYAFDGCTSLTEIAVDNGNETYSSINGVLTDQRQTTLIKYPEGKTGNYNVPKSIRTLGDYAFANNMGLSNVTGAESVTKIGNAAFANCMNLTSISIPNSVISLGDSALSNCGLTNLTIPDGVTTIGQWAVAFCRSLTNITIGNGVTDIGTMAFNGCDALKQIVMGNSVAKMGGSAFISCIQLKSVCFLGNAPILGAGVFAGVTPTIYYLPGTTGWGPTWGGRPTAWWYLPYPVILRNSIGIKTNQFGFMISWATNKPVMIEGRGKLGSDSWTRIQTNTLTGGTAYFNDPEWTKYPTRFYRSRGLN